MGDSEIRERVWIRDGYRESNKAEKWVERKRESAYKERMLREIIKKLMRVNILLKYLVK